MSQYYNNNTLSHLTLTIKTYLATFIVRTYSNWLAIALKPNDEVRFSQSQKYNENNHTFFNSK